jgi:lipid A 3-O-deacylase
LKAFQRILIAASFVVGVHAAGGRSASAQTPATISLRIDNDAFDFWMLPWNRPDEEYSSGVHITYDGGDAPWWSRAALSSMARCAVTTRDCRTGRAEIGQDLYTAATSANAPQPAPGSRPNAGWLYVSETARSLHGSRSDELSVSLGVTGPPSLGEYTQSLAHRAAPAFNRPSDWTDQVRFEPGVIVRYEQRRVIGSGAGRLIGFDFIPRIAATVGNVSTAGEIGFQARTGWHLRHPWLPTNGPFEFALIGGVSGRAVARDLFLDGNTFNPGRHVGHEPFVGTGELGVQIRFRALSLTYRGVNNTRSYSAGPKWHPWASVVGGVTFDR